MWENISLLHCYFLFCASASLSSSLNCNTSKIYGLHTQWDSFTPRKGKINLIRTLAYRCLRICSSPCLLQSALDDRKKHLSRNGYPRGIISYNMNDVVNKHQNKPKDIITVPKKDIFIVLPYLGFQSKIVTQQIRSCINKFYGCFNPNIIFRSIRRIKSFSL